jgi:hypothetical protein
LFKFAFELIFLGLAGATLIGMCYFYFTAISFLVKILSKIVGDSAAAPLALLGFPFLFGVVLLLLVKLFQGRGLGNLLAVLILLGVPLLGVWSIKTGKWG